MIIFYTLKNKRLSVAENYVLLMQVWYVSLSIRHSEEGESYALSLHITLFGNRDGEKFRLALKSL